MELERKQRWTKNDKLDVLKKINCLEKEIKDLKKELKNKTIESVTLKEELEISKEDFESLKEELEISKEECEELQNELETSIEDIEILKEGQETLVDELNRSLDEIIELETNYDKIKNENTKIKESIEFLKNLPDEVNEMSIDEIILISKQLTTKINLDPKLVCYLKESKRNDESDDDLINRFKNTLKNPQGRDSEIVEMLIAHAMEDNPKFKTMFNLKPRTKGSSLEINLKNISSMEDSVIYKPTPDKYGVDLVYKVGKEVHAIQVKYGKTKLNLSKNGAFSVRSIYKKICNFRRKYQEKDENDKKIYNFHFYIFAPGGCNDNVHGHEINQKIKIMCDEVIEMVYPFVSNLLIDGCGKNILYDIKSENDEEI
jgi:DNA repair exonuclease SbcCD ATPase subunit